MENLAWGACQIHCYCNSTISLPESASASGITHSGQPESLPSMNDTSIAAAMKGQGQVVFKTEPKILFCDLRLAPGETKSCKLKWIVYLELTLTPAPLCQISLKNLFRCRVRRLIREPI